MYSWSNCEDRSILSRRPEYGALRKSKKADHGLCLIATALLCHLPSQIVLLRAASAAFHPIYPRYSSITSTSPLVLASVSESLFDVNNATATTGKVMDEVELLRIQVQKLREDAREIRLSIERDTAEKERQRIEKVDRWIQHLLIYQSVGNVEQLNTVPRVVQMLMDERFSPDQVYQIFDRLCQTTRISGRDSLFTNSLLQLLVEAVGKLDEYEREDNPNKRWNQIVERTLHRRLFAMEWGINLENIDTKQPD